MTTKRINPYQRLLEEIRSYIRKVKYRHTKTMWIYPKKVLTDGWDLGFLYQRTAAAEQLGYDVQLKATEEGLVVQYVKKIPEPPYSW